MQKKAIENWLTKTNERNYQAPFCQILLNKGYKIIYRSKHGPFEKGKDIVAIDNNGDYLAYQLKTGDIDLSIWRKIKGEIDELVQLPIDHPLIDRKKIHKAYLVTNGYISDVVKAIIKDINEDNVIKDRKYAYLDIINKDMLLNDFIKIDTKILPSELNEIDSFLKIYLSDGNDLIDKSRLFDYFNTIIFKDVFSRRSDIISSITNSVIINSYLLDKFQVSNNYYAIFEAWTILAGLIVRYAKKKRLEEEHFKDTYKLIFNELIDNLIILKNEFESKEDFIEGNWIGDGGIVYKARLTMIFGVLSALKIYLNKDREEKNFKLLELIEKNSKYLWFWGESAFPFFFNIIKYLESLNKTNLAMSLLINILNLILNQNSHKNMEGKLPGPYICVSKIIRDELGIDENEIDYKEYVGRSFILESLIFMLVKRNKKDVLEQKWKELSYFHFREFTLNNIEDLFTLREENGVNNTNIPKKTQSWKELKEAYKVFTNSPELYKKHIYLLNFFCIIAPHRMTKNVNVILDNYL